MSFYIYTMTKFTNDLSINGVNNSVLIKHLEYKIKRYELGYLVTVLYPLMEADALGGDTLLQ